MRFFTFASAVLCGLLLLAVIQTGCAGTTGMASNQTTAQSGDPTALRVTTRQMPDGQDNLPYWAPLTAAGGKPPYRWSVASGQLPEGLALDSKGVVSGTAEHIGNYHFTMQVEDSATAPAANADLGINVVSPGTGASLQSCAGFGCYGPAIGADGLANTTVGPNGNTVSYRFRAQRSGAVRQLRLYLITDHVGYSAGTSGKLLITFYSDDGTSAHNPSNTKLASYLVDSPLSGTPWRDFPLITFSAPPTLVAGQLYHIVFTNADSEPSVNYLSVDALYVETPTTPGQPGFSDMDCAVLLGRDGSWSQRKGYTPIMELLYADGISTGVGYMEGWVGAQQAVSGINMVRETFTVSGAARKINTVGIRAARVLGNDDLRVRLENENGSLIEEGSIAAAAFPLSSSPQHRWATLALSSAHTLLPGDEYHLVLEAAATSTYKVFPIRKGAAYDFADSTFFDDGSAEFKSGSQWVGWTQWGVSNRTDSDLQFYLGLAP